VPRVRRHRGALQPRPIEASSPGRADLNLIDYDRLQLRVPESVADLPAGATVCQRTDGYVATVVAARPSRGQDTVPGGRLVHGPQVAGA
jgi:N-acyl-D-aspartate/D-glutamate deacylase